MTWRSGRSSAADEPTAPRNAARATAGKTPRRRDMHSLLLGGWALRSGIRRTVRQASRCRVPSYPFRERVPQPAERLHLPHRQPRPELAGHLLFEPEVDQLQRAEHALAPPAGDAAARGDAQLEAAAQPREAAVGHAHRTTQTPLQHRVDAP